MRCQSRRVAIYLPPRGGYKSTSKHSDPAQLLYRSGKHHRRAKRISRFPSSYHGVHPLPCGPIARPTGARHATAAGLFPFMFPAARNKKIGGLPVIRKNRSCSDTRCAFLPPIHHVPICNQLSKYVPPVCNLTVFLLFYFTFGITQHFEVEDPLSSAAIDCFIAENRSRLA